MKEGIHPEYRPVIFYDVSVDFKVLTQSTASSKEKMKWEDGKEYPVIRFDLSSASHAYYTGKAQMITDKGGRIEQFRTRYAVQEAAKKAEAAARAAQAAGTPADS